MPADVSQEANIQLAISDIRSSRGRSIRRAAELYNVPLTTLQRRLAGRRYRGDAEPNSKRLTSAEEETLTRHILDYDAGGKSVSKAVVKEMADRLLTDRGEPPVGKTWVHNFIKRNPELKTRLDRPYDYQRAACEDSSIIQPWFERVRDYKARHGISDEDIYNFDETGFMMGKISAEVIVTSSQLSGRRKRIQPGNREWVTVIQGIGSTGCRIPPFIIFAGKVLITSWFANADIPDDWILEVSPNGWTNNRLAVAWLEHLDEHTKGRRVGARRLLIIDGHESHCSAAFQALCKEKSIHTLCMPPHSSHLLQPLDVACFSPLKRAYSAAISTLARRHIHHIHKETFLEAFRNAHIKAMTKENIRSGFRATGLVPYDPEVVLGQLDIRLRTPTPPLRSTTSWTPKTPRNASEIHAQSTLIRNCVHARRGSSASSLDDKINQLAKGAQTIAHEMVLLREEVARLRDASESAVRRKKAKRKYLRTEETLTVGEIRESLTAGASIGRLDSETPAKRVRGERRCGNCGEAGHDSRTCMADSMAAVDSDSSQSDVIVLSRQ